jgi:hypothetical protein
VHYTCLRALRPVADALRAQEAVLRFAPASGGPRLDLEGIWTAQALSELQGELLVCARVGRGALPAAQAGARGVAPAPTRKAAVPDAALPPPAGASAEGPPAAKRARLAAAPAPAGAGRPLKPAAGPPKLKLAPQPVAIKTEDAEDASQAPGRGAEPQLAAAAARASHSTLPVSTPTPAVTAQLVRAGVVIATLHDVVRCLAMASRGDVVHATGVHDGACLVLSAPEVSLRGWPAGAPTPPSAAPKGFTVCRRGGHALQLAADNCGVEGVLLRALDALVVLDDVSGARVLSCALEAGHGRRGSRRGIGCQLRRGSSASVRDTTVAGFGLAGVVVELGAALSARCVRVSDTAGFGMRFDGAAACSILDCSADGAGAAPGGAGAMECAFYINAAPSDFSGCKARNCVVGFRAEFPSSHREPAAAAPARAKLGPLVTAFDLLRSTPHKAWGITSSSHASHAVVLDEGVAMDLTGAQLSSCGGSGVRVCVAPAGFTAKITLRLKTLRGCALGGVTFEAAAGGDAVAAGRVEPATEAALLAGGCDARGNAGGNWRRNAEPCSPAASS